MSRAHDPAALSVHLPSVPDRGVRIAVSANRDALDFDDTDFTVPARLTLDGRLDRMDQDGFRLLARLGGAVEVECVRCLEPVSLVLDEELDLVYLPLGALASASGSRRHPASGDRFLDADDMNVSAYEGDRLELAETLWEQVHLALPPKPLCLEDCLGLCPSCGADRNLARRRPERACGCEGAAPLGSRGGLGALRDLPGLPSAS